MRGGAVLSIQHFCMRKEKRAAEAAPFSPQLSNLADACLGAGAIRAGIRRHPLDISRYQSRRESHSTVSKLTVTRSVYHNGAGRGRDRDCSRVLCYRRSRGRPKLTSVQQRKGIACARDHVVVILGTLGNGSLKRSDRIVVVRPT